jgi:hypothetical protein
MLAVTDTSPLHYLILIGQVDLLSLLYTHVIIPQAVVGESSTPIPRLTSVPGYVPYRRGARSGSPNRRFPGTCSDSGQGNARR